MDQKEKAIQRAEAILNDKIGPVVSREGPGTPDALVGITGVLLAHIAKGEIRAESLEARLAELEARVAELEQICLPGGLTDDYR